MILSLSFKTPDVVRYALQDTFGPEDELTEEQSAEREDAEAAVEKYVKYGEMLTVEINTETGEARVVPVGR